MSVTGPVERLSRWLASRRDRAARAIDRHEAADRLIECAASELDQLRRSVDAVTPTPSPAARGGAGSGVKPR